MTSNSETQLLTLPQGDIKGVQRKTVYDAAYFSFEGIPYGKAPLGELRFKAPQPADPWRGIKDCTTYATKPSQKNPMTGVYEGSEDCLYLNVYTKTFKSDKPLPVMFFIYGGGFYMGGATTEVYSPDYFMQEDVILVTFNYRLDSLGFLSLKDSELQVPGNAGLKDQVLALKWVKQYIAYFNGDPNNITVFGESAGGASTHYMMITEQTRGLFQKAIPMSGSALNAWANMPQTGVAYRLAKHHGYDGEDDDKQVLAFLRKLDASTLVNHDIVTDQDRRNGILFTFGPTVEPYIGDDCVVPKEPLEMLKTTWSNDIPILIGGTSFEGLLMYPRLKMSPAPMEALKEYPELLLPQEIRESHSAEEAKELSQKLVKLHFGDKGLSAERLFKFLDLYSYKIFWHGFHRTVLSRLRHATAPTYLYRFDFFSLDFNHFRKMFCGADPVRGVGHADDLSYLFYSLMAWKLEPDTAEYKTIKRMVGMWTAFAKTSNPNCAEIQPVVWEPLESSDPSRGLNISNEVELVDLPEKAKLAVWDSLYKKEDLY